MSRKYDVLVVGGGINGVGVAQAAAAAGHSVLLLEKQRLGDGTSSRSSKLIHGGLRYLESFELGLVRESLRERTLMLSLAPELVRLQRFVIPVFKATRRRPWQLRVGLSLYAALAGFERGTEFGTLARSQWSDLDGLRQDDLQSIFYYHDAQTDDQALTRAAMASAVALGAEFEEQARFVGAQLGTKRSEVHYESTGQTHSVQARVIVNAAGPWVNDVLSQVQPVVNQRRMELVQGAHLVVDGALEQGCYYLESRRDGRAIFVMPWKGKTLVGTTETKFSGMADDAAATQAEKNYLAAILSYHFPRYRQAITEKRFSAFAGLRVLPAGEGHAFHRSREVILDTERDERPRLVTIYGGKLTAWRATAAKVLRRISTTLPDRAPRADTAELPLKPVN